MPPTPVYRRKSRRPPADKRTTRKADAAIRIEEAHHTCAGDSMRSHHKPAAAKALGAYYTDNGIAAFLTQWALRKASDTVLDPSAGGGAFLAAAAEQIGRLGGDAPAQVCGVEVDAGTCTRVGAHFGTTLGWAPRLYCEDFFRVRPRDIGEFDTVVGNPPFIRYQQFSGEVRDRALGCAVRQGVKLSRLASSWAPFLVHSGGFVRPGGRLAMVLPHELLHAGYARPVLAYLAATFRRVSILTFREKLFPDLNENTVLVLADEKATSKADGEVRVLDSQRAESLLSISAQSMWQQAEQMSREMLRGERRAIEQLLPQRTRDLYQALQTAPGFTRLGSVADVGIGYVSGANEFFHPTAELIEKFEIPAKYLRRAVRRGRALTSLRFTSSDWEKAKLRCDASLLLHLSEPEDKLPAGVRRYLASGKLDHVDLRYKCRMRSPWYAVPHVHTGDALLTYMSGARPLFAVNSAKAVTTNTLHVVNLRRGAPSAERLAFGWLSSLTSLSVEIEGHALGGGMLKLEPTEAARVLLPISATPENLHELDLDQEFVDECLLKTAGITSAECRLLTAGAEMLRERRGVRG